MLSRIATCCKNFQILIRSPLQMKSLYLLSKFHGDIFNGLGEKWIWKLPPEMPLVDVKAGFHRSKYKANLNQF